MMLVTILFIPICAGFLAWLSQYVHRRLPGWISIVGLVIDFFLVTFLWVVRGGGLLAGSRVVESEAPWFARLGHQLSSGG